MLLAASLKVSAGCPDCHDPNPLNAIVERLPCHRCGAEIDLGGKDAWWLDTQYWDETVGKAISWPEAGEVDIEYGLECTLHITALRQDPCCRACGRALPLQELVAAGERGTGLACGACHALTPIRAASHDLRAVVPSLRWIVGEQRVTSPGVGLSGVIVTCASCGASLDVDLEHRTVRCRYCSASNVLHEGVWSRLHAPPQREWFHLLLDVDEASMLRWRYLGCDGEHGSELPQRDAANPATSRVALDVLARMSESRIRERVAANPNASPEALGLLAGDEDYSARVNVARHPQTPPEALTKLATDKHRDVLLGLTARTDLPAEAQTRLVANPDYAVRKALASSPSCTTGNLAQLERDPDADVRAAVAGNPRTPSEMLIRMALDTDDKVQVAVARHPDTPVDTLRELAHEEDRGIEVLRAVGAHPATPLDVLMHLSRHPLQMVSRRAKRHPTYVAKPWWRIL